MGVHLRMLERPFSGDVRVGPFIGLAERFWRLRGDGDSLALRLEESRCKSIARSTFPSARMRTSKSDSGDAHVKIEDKIASLVSVSSSSSFPSFPIVDFCRRNSRTIADAWRVTSSVVG